MDGTDVDPTDFLNAAEGVNGWTPLHLAAVGEYLDVVYLLMDAGCNPNVKDKVNPHNSLCFFERSGSVTVVHKCELVSPR